jgi:hypothetical protein
LAVFPSTRSSTPTIAVHSSSPTKVNC